MVGRRASFFSFPVGMAQPGRCELLVSGRVNVYRFIMSIWGTQPMANLVFFSKTIFKKYDAQVNIIKIGINPGKKSTCDMKPPSPDGQKFLLQNWKKHMKKNNTNQVIGGNI